MLPTELITEILRLVNNLIEGTPIEQRHVTAIQWFWFWWPLSKPLLLLQKVPADVVQNIEDTMKKVQA